MVEYNLQPVYRDKCILLFSFDLTMRAKLLTKPTECNPVHALMSDSDDHKVPTGVELLKYCVNPKGPHHSTDLNVKHGYQHETYTKERYIIYNTNAKYSQFWLRWRRCRQ